MRYQVVSLVRDRWREQLAGTRQLRITVAVALASALLFGRGVARADESAPSGEALVLPTPAPTPSERWYGYQTILVDLVPLVATPVGIAVTVQQAKGDNNGLVGLTVLGLGASTYLFGAPTVHWAHGRVAIGFLSLGIRILAPVAGLGLGAVASQIATDSKNQDGIPVGAALGALAAMVVDSAVLGWEKVGDQPAAAATKTPAMGIAPSVVVTKQAFSLGLTSRF